MLLQFFLLYTGSIKIDGYRVCLIIYADREYARQGTDFPLDLFDRMLAIDMVRNKINTCL